MADFKECVEECGMADIKQAGRFFTWSNKREREQRIFSKINRVIANEDWRNSFDSVVVTYLLEGDYDHCLGVISMHKVHEGRKTFKFFNMWVQAPEFLDTV